MRVTQAMTIDQMRAGILGQMGVPCSEDRNGAPCGACANRRDEVAAFELAVQRAASERTSRDFLHNPSWRNSAPWEGTHNIALRLFPSPEDAAE